MYFLIFNRHLYFKRPHILSSYNSDNSYAELSCLLGLHFRIIWFDIRYDYQNFWYFEQVQNRVACVPMPLVTIVTCYSNLHRSEIQLRFPTAGLMAFHKCHFIMDSGNYCLLKFWGWNAVECLFIETCVFSHIST